jgi:tripartite-type tricarboxylate transporter receptor subunit TctC
MAGSASSPSANIFATLKSAGLLLLVGLAGAPTPARAQNWPQRPVRVLVPFAAGGNIDVIARLTGQRLAEALGQQFIIENRVGGNGTIAGEAAARAAPDGYTLFWAGPAVVSIFPAITKAAYDPVKDFKPISVIGTNPQVLVVNGKLPINSVADFISYVKTQPQKLPYAGGGGPGSLSNLLMALFLKRAGLEMTSVSYRGTAPAMTDLVAGHIPTMFVPLSEALPQAQAGNIRMLAVSGQSWSA